MIHPVLNHLWQSTLFACVAGLLTLVLRTNRAQTRYWLWLAASVKFLIPFAVLVAAGSQVSWRRTTSPVIVETGFAVVMEQVSQPFAVETPTVALPALPSKTEPIRELLILAWATGLVAIGLRWWIRWRRVRAAVLGASPLLLPIGIEVKSSSAMLEPGVFGVFRPVLLFPKGITERLTPVQLRAVVAHEMCHVRRRDNLATAAHMIVEAVFWFHPLVWWLGARLVEERERACDEEVLRAGSDAQTYAESILKVCEFYLASPLESMAGVSGANLKKRIEEIMTQRITNNLELSKKLLLAGAGLLALAGPFVVGIVNAPSVRAQTPRSLAQGAQSAPTATPTDTAKQAATAQPATHHRFDVVSIKPCKPGVTSGAPVLGGDSSPGRLSIGCGILADTDNIGLIQVAYNRYASGQLTSLKVIPIEGGPDWIHSERYEIDAKSDGQPSILMMEGPMMQTILEDRFKLKLHREIRQGPVYELALGKGSSKLKPLQDGSCTPVVAGSPLPLLPDGQHRCRNMVSPRGKVDVEGGTLSMFAGLLGMVLDRPVVDKTGMTSNFEIHLVFSPDDFAAPQPAAADPGAPAAVTATDAPRIFQAIQEQLGLRLVLAKGPVDVLVIDHIERPSEN
jgi:bla regulator protein blaR1